MFLKVGTITEKEGHRSLDKDRLAGGELYPVYFGFHSSAIIGDRKDWRISCQLSFIEYIPLQVANNEMLAALLEEPWWLPPKEGHWILFGRLIRRPIRFWWEIQVTRIFRWTSWFEQNKYKGSPRAHNHATIWNLGKLYSIVPKWKMHPK